MNGSRLAGVVLIFGIATAAWAILSGTMYSRTSRSEASLRPRVEGLWGGKHAQAAPTVAALSDVATGGQLHEPLLLDSSKIDVNLRADFRRKGLIWHRTYEVEFTGDYTVTNDSVWAREIEATLQFPSPGATYDGLDFSIKKTRARDASGGVSGVSITASAEPGETVPITVHYRSRGLDTWRYSFGPATAQVDNCTIAVSTNFARIDFPDATLAPTRKTETPDGWDLTWEFKSLVTGLGVAIDMPMQLDPGPWATRVSAFAPIGLFFFLSLLVIVGMLDGKRLHPMHYAFVCAAFFSFHLLLAYLVDHVHMHLAFSIAAICSVVLVVSYLLRAA
ncbi:MAG TPA: inner membrane CreD family protein, partial [Armatimonadota bacterium]|nr:inner membrane CreD family protein [Armatimonadota bacterium]